MSTTTLRYTGELPRVFTTGNVGEVKPGGEFMVDDSIVDRFYALDYIERADGKPKPRAKAKRARARAGDSKPNDGDQAGDNTSEQEGV